jgi:hypothetical protein
LQNGVLHGGVNRGLGRIESCVLHRSLFHGRSFDWCFLNHGLLDRGRLNGRFFYRRGFLDRFCAIILGQNWHDRSRYRPGC